jgi:acyl-CoA synthetase (AMP-forming)/AMP-acid ligase II
MDEFDLHTSPPSGGATLSSRIFSALHQRDQYEALFVLVSRPCRQPAASTVGGGTLDVTKTVVTKKIWSAFVLLLHQRLSTTQPCPDFASEGTENTVASSGEATFLNERCDVGLYCNETFYACVAESACLFLGRSFCLFRPDDPPLRLARLEKRRRPRYKLHQEEIVSLLRSALEGRTSLSVMRNGNNLLAPHNNPLAGEFGASETIGDACIAYFVHTSGSTGDPKCVVASRGNLHAYLRNFVYHCDGLAVTQDTPCRFFCLSSPFFDPSIGDMVTTLCTPHSTFYTCDQESLLSGCVGELMAAVGPTHVVSTPAVWRTISVHALPRSTAVSDARGSAALMKVFLGGERMSQDVISTWAGSVELYNIYGVTEVTIYQSVQRVLPGTRATDVTCGAGVGTHITVDMGAFHTSDTEGKNCGDEDEGFGEVVLHGDQVCYGYANDAHPATSTHQGPGDTPSPFGYDSATNTRFFRTGDVGKLVGDRRTDERLQLVLRGRRDWQMKLNGQRVSLEEVEGTVQRALEGIFTQCACFCVRGDNGVTGTLSTAPVICTAIVFTHAPSDKLLRCHTRGITAALQEILALHLPAFMIPRHFLLYTRGSSLPQTSTGKVNRAELARTASEVMQTALPSREGGGDAVDTGECAAPLHDTLHMTVQLAWESQLGTPVHDNTHYIHAGGDSLGALKLSRAIYLSLHNDSDDGIDEHGGLPPPFQPCVLLQHPRLGDYVTVLRHELRNDCHFDDRHLSSPHRTERSRGGEAGDSSVTVSTPSSEAARMNALLREVVAAQCVGLAERLLRLGVVDVNGGYTREHRCVTPLHLVVSSCEGEDDGGAIVASALCMATLLLDFGAKPTVVTPDGVTPAHLAAAVSAPLLQLLLGRAPSLTHCRDGRQQSLLHFAARNGNVETTRLLLAAYQQKLDTRDKWQRTPVHWAVLNGHLTVLEAMRLYFAASPSSSSSPPSTASLAVQVAVVQEETAGGSDGGGLKRSRRQGGSETARFSRLARKKTYLAYETLCAIAQRTRPGDEQMMELCRALSTAVGEQPTLS